jgi:hypothetical protein
MGYLVYKSIPPYTKIQVGEMVTRAGYRKDYSRLKGIALT